jgi:chromosome segregation ATPase
MNRSSFLVVGLVILAVPCSAQTGQGDSQVLQALLSEVRQLRRELQATTITAQRTQILLYRMQGQEAAVARASQRLDEAREMHAGAQAERKQLAAEIKKHEGLVGNMQTPAVQRKSLEDRLPEEGARLESFEAQERQEQTREIEAQQQLRTEEAALAELRDRLDRLDKSLEDARHQLGARSPSGGAAREGEP